MRTLHGGYARNVKRFRGGLVVKAHRLLYHSNLGLRVIKKKKKVRTETGAPHAPISGKETAYPPLLNVATGDV